MAKQFTAIDPPHRAFIEAQKIFFTASAAAGTRINLSPRSTDCLRVLDSNAVCYLDRTGSGNETAAHMRADGRLTIMLCAFEGAPRIMRLYGHGRIVPRGTADYDGLLEAHFAQEPTGARQFVVLSVDLVQTSCGFGVPLFSHEGERENLDHWTEAKLASGPEGLTDYQRANNAASMDGLPTGMFD